MWSTSTARPISTALLLGMLLLLRDHGGSEKADIRLVNCNPDVRKVLAVSNFEQLFAIA
jgi:HptB-dependent secretion and biofilm anti anti-sigma factor